MKRPHRNAKTTIHLIISIYGEDPRTHHTSVPKRNTVLYTYIYGRRWSNPINNNKTRLTIVLRRGHGSLSLWQNDDLVVSTASAAAACADP